MTAVEVTETFVGSTIDNGSIKSGAGLRFGIYTATKANATDYVIFGDFTTVTRAIAFNSDWDPTTISASNRVTGSAGTGATTFLVWGS